MKILILGASSYVGARIYFDLRQSHDVIGTYNQTQLSSSLQALDITKAAEVTARIGRVNPDIIIHVANNPSPRWCEANPELAKELNETSTQTIVDAANAAHAKLVFISSFAAIEPIDVYGHAKQAAEAICQQTKSGWIILRSSLIVGYSPNTKNDRPFNRFLKNLDTGTKAEYDTSWKFQPTYLGHISEVIDQIVQKSISNQTIAVAVNSLKSRYDLAKDILEPFGVTVSPIDAGDTSPTFSENLELLTTLGLPTYDYQTIISKIVEEIRQRERFIL